ncbi:hypothetical protein KM031_08765 [Gemmobacter fulvus]|uniref:DNA alkylation repair protein n=1 Tax=Gemmobacter fulvus TaxID=2840474 RepID=A0A975S080_9RHOB|nr:hypothetical protein [Gemmobacter fulvus]MBT9247139.1 hypothetical protein [Gemmobacter fulvus]QWK88986.1 hypothetical protein KM031_08765 [Gemmobacter fulvus]
MAQQDAAPALKEIFNVAALEEIAQAVQRVHPAFPATRFLALCAEGHADMALMARLHRVSEALHATLPADYLTALDILLRLVPHLKRGFLTLFLPDFVARYGLHSFEPSMEALKAFTPYGSSEFAVRAFLRQDFDRTLAVMQEWAGDDDPHVRRLASEGSRPRLPWSFKLDRLVADPAPVRPILTALNADPSLYVRKSVANHLNDISKDHPGWALDLIGAWPRDVPETAWITKHALRSLIKAGDGRALALIGAGGPAQARVADLQISPAALALGGEITLSFALISDAAEAQRLVVDYAVHYVKKSGGSAAKVFKLKLLTLDPGAVLHLSQRRALRNFTTRVHYPGRHRVDILVNGAVLASGAFDLLPEASEGQGTALP